MRHFNCHARSRQNRKRLIDKSTHRNLIPMKITPVPKVVNEKLINYSLKDCIIIIDTPGCWGSNFDHGMHGRR